MKRTDLQPDEFGAYYLNYIEQVDPELDLIQAFNQSRTKDFFQKIPDSGYSSKYGADKWTIGEVFQHIIDSERVFTYRMFRVGRGDQTPLPGFDQNVFMAPSRATEKSKIDLLTEFAATRSFTLSVVNSFVDPDWKRIGEASGNPLSARASAFIILGHEIWHTNIIEERYSY